MKCILAASLLLGVCFSSFAQQNTASTSQTLPFDWDHGTPPESGDFVRTLGFNSLRQFDTTLGELVRVEVSAAWEQSTQANVEGQSGVLMANNVISAGYQSVRTGLRYGLRNRGLIVYEEPYAVTASCSPPAGQPPEFGCVGSESNAVSVRSFFVDEIDETSSDPYFLAMDFLIEHAGAEYVVDGFAGGDATVNTFNTGELTVTFFYVPFVDSDGDGVFDPEDTCTDTPNVAQRDTDLDGYGNACDADLNNDCIINLEDLGLLRLAYFSSDPLPDLNGDGVVNVIDLGVMRRTFFEAPGPSGVTSICD